MNGWPILSVVTFLPLVGAALILFLRGEAEAVARNARFLALWTSLITFAVSVLGLWFPFDRASADFQFVEQADWIPAFGIRYHMGVDGISMLFVLLSTLLTPICVLASWKAIHIRVKEYMISFLVLETFMVGSFCALDFVLFYMFFEGVLIPMFLIIGIWGGPRRVYSAFKFFLYTLAGSVLMLVGILAIYFLQYKTTGHYDLSFAAFHAPRATFTASASRPSNISTMRASAPVLLSPHAGGAAPPTRNRTLASFALPSSTVTSTGWRLGSPSPACACGRKDSSE